MGNTNIRGGPSLMPPERSAPSASPWHLVRSGLSRAVDIVRRPQEQQMPSPGSGDHGRQRRTSTDLGGRGASPTCAGCLGTASSHSVTAPEGPAGSGTDDAGWTRRPQVTNDSVPGTLCQGLCAEDWASGLRPGRGVRNKGGCQSPGIGHQALGAMAAERTHTHIQASTGRRRRPTVRLAT
jgi:hypothetical protein